MTSLDGINDRSIQTLLRGEDDSKQSDEIQATGVCAPKEMSGNPALKATSFRRLLGVWRVEAAEIQADGYDSPLRIR